MWENPLCDAGDMGWRLVGELDPTGSRPTKPRKKLQLLEIRVPQLESSHASVKEPKTPNIQIHTVKNKNKKAVFHRVVKDMHRTKRNTHIQNTGFTWKFCSL